MSELYECLYINRARDLDRRDAMEEHLQAIGLRNFRRFDAAEGEKPRGRLTAGEVGCNLSHFSLITEKPEGLARSKHRLILEDDARLCTGFDTKLTHLIEKLDKLSLKWDCIFLTSVIAPHFTISHAKAMNVFRANQKQNVAGEFMAPRANQIYKRGVISYLVNYRSVDKLDRLLRPHIESADPVAIDEVFSKGIDQEKIAAFLTVPFLATCDERFLTTMHDRENGKLSNERVPLNGQLAPHIYFIDNTPADFARLTSRVSEHTPALDGREELLARLFLYDSVGLYKKNNDP